MKTSLHKLLSTAAVLAVTSTFAIHALAQDSRSEDRKRYFQMNMIDVNKDGMVSKKEFLDMVSKTWDMHMADAAAEAGAKPDAAKGAKAKDRLMTLEEYRAFAKMYGLDIGG